MDYKKELERYIEEFREKRNKGSLNYLQTFFKDKKAICVFGAGYIGRRTVDIFSNAGVEVEFFCDNDSNKWGREIYKGIKCVSPDVLQANKDNLYIVVAMNKYKEILKQIKFTSNISVMVDLCFNKYKDNLFHIADDAALKIYKQNLLKVMEILGDEQSKKILLTMVKKYCKETPFHQYYEGIYNYDEQYLPQGIICLTNNENFVDCGAYTGDSMEAFLKKVDNKFDHYYAFELAKENFKILKNHISRNFGEFSNKFSVYNQGVWDKSEKICYSESVEGTSSLMSKISINEGNYGIVDALDNVIKGKKVTFIKMDIEGAELRALHGAKNIIKEQKPKLAISVYHKIEDLWEIPLYMKECVPEYSIYLRHHTLLDQDTVCYAVLK